MTVLPRMAGSFAVVLATYWLYVLLVVPWIEPDAPANAGRASTAAERDAARDMIARYRQIFSKYFPAGHWALASPKVLESPQAVLLFQDYTTQEDGRVKLEPCAIIFYVDKPQEVPGPERRALVLEAPQGAILRFDETSDIGRGKFGRPLHGHLPGSIAIRGTLSDSQQGDLHVTATDVQLTEKRIWTDERVQFRLGQSHGEGKQLLIRLLPAPEEMLPDGRTPDVGGVDSIELKQQVKMHLALDGLAELADRNDRAGDRATSLSNAAHAAGRHPAPPQDAGTVQITCQGPFRFDLLRQEATFHHRVDVLQLRPEGTSDRLSCEQLTVLFSDVASAGDGEGDGALPQGGQPRLQPTSVVAEGDPVTITSEHSTAHGRCQRLEYDVATRAITLSSDREVMLYQGSNEFHAPVLIYQPAEVSGRLPQLLWAQGPGRVLAVAGDNPTARITASFTRELHLRPHGGQHVLSLIGDPQHQSATGAPVQLSAPGLGGVDADEIHVYLNEWASGPGSELAANEARTEGSSQPNGTQGGPTAAAPRDPWRELNVQPDRVWAKSAQSGARRVRLTSPRLTGRTQELSVWFIHPSERPGNPSPSQPVIRQPELASRRAIPTQDLTRASSQRYDIAGDLLQVELAVRGETIEPKNVTVDGDVTFREVDSAPGEQPFVVRGRRLVVQDADTQAMSVTITGAPASTQARGMTLRGDTIALSTASNRLDINAPGTLIVPVMRDLDGQPLAEPMPLRITWLDRMELVGRKLHFQRSVVAQGRHSRLLTESLEAHLSEPLRFDAGGRSGQNDQGDVDIEQIVCRDGVRLENTTLEGEVQLATERLECENLSISQKTGLIDAQGPGSIVSVRVGTSGPLALGAAPATRRPDGVKPTDRVNWTNGATRTDGTALQYLRTDFQRHAKGNLHQRAITLYGQVRSTYGPVQGWDQVIDITSPEGLGTDGVHMESDQLSVTQSRPLEPGQGSILLDAQGNVVAEGRKFTAWAHRMTYEQAKDLVVLEGTGQAEGTGWTSARLTQQEHVGGLRREFAARKILYRPGTGEAKVEDALHFLAPVPARQASSPNDASR